MRDWISSTPWALGLYGLWLVAGYVDFHLHRRTDLASTSGVQESALHGAQLACVGIGVIAWLSFSSTRALGALLVALSLAHVGLAYADTKTADNCRRITPLEQHVHSILDASPWIFAFGVAVQAAPEWALVWNPRAGSIWATLLVPALVMVGLPWVAEMSAALRWRGVHRRCVKACEASVHVGGTEQGLEPADLLRSKSAMSDDKRNTGSPDRDRINVNEDYELQYWTMRLGVSAEELRNAVKAVGPSAETVRKHLSK